MPLVVSQRVVVAGIVALTSTSTSLAAERVFREASHDGFELRYVGEIPIAFFSGTPEQIGEQHAQLLGEGWRPLRQYAFGFLDVHADDPRWKLLLGASKALIARAPDAHQRELDTLCKVAGDDGDVVRVANTLPELRRFGCSTLIVAQAHSATGGPLFGRNLDFPTLGILDKYGLVMVFRGEGKRPFVSVAMPGVVGVLSAMNNAGLAIATLDSYETADGSIGFDPTGVPLSFLFRRVMEECGTVDEVEAMLNSTKATTWMNLAVCDRDGGAVFEITPKQVVRRDADGAILPCTNHFRSNKLSVGMSCERYDVLAKPGQRQLDVETVRQQLHAVNQGELTFQTMVFEPRELVLHLALGKPPTSGLPLERLELRPLLTDRPK